MTNRDPNMPELTRLTVDFYDCLGRYFSISDEEKLRIDKEKEDINLVCFYELKQIREHFRSTKGLNYADFFKMHPKDELALRTKLSNL